MPRKAASRSAIHLLPLAASILVAAALGGAATPVVADAIPVTGFVLDAEGAPLDGAEISLLEYLDPSEITRRYAEGEATREVLATAAADARGFYRVEAPDIGLYLLTVTAPGKRPLIRRLQPLIAAVSVPTARLPPAREITVTVRGEDGAAIAGAYVAVSSRPESRGPEARRTSGGWLPERDRAISGEDGAVKLVVGPDEKLDLTVSTPEHVPALIERASSDSARVDIDLERGEARVLELVDEADEPLPGVLVRTQGTMPAGFSDDDGRLTVRVADEAVELAAEAPPRRASLTLEPRAATDDSDDAESRAAAGGAEGDAENDRSGDDVTIFRLEAPERIAGTVLDADSRRPIAGALVWSGRRPREATRSDRQGGYAVPADLGWLRAAAPGYQVAFGQVDADSGQAPTLLLEPAASLAGRIVDARGEPIAGVTLGVSGLGVEMMRMRRPQGDTVTGPDGAFSLAGLPIDVVLELRARADGYATKSRRIEPLAIGEARSDLELRLQPALAAVGRVVDGDERPIAGARVEMLEQPASADFRQLMRRMRADAPPAAASTDAEGRFRVENLDPATYRLTATADGFAPATVPGVALEADAGEVDVGTVVVVPGVTLEGRVADPDGGGLGGVTVRAGLGGHSMTSLMGGPGAEPREATTGADGRFTFDDLLPEQTVELTAEKEGWAAEPQNAIARADQTPLEIVMSPAARLVVRVRDSAGEAIENARVTASRSGGRMGSRPLFGSTASDGEATIEGLFPARYDIQVSADGLQAFTLAGAELGPASEPIDVVLEAGLRLAGRVLDAAGQPVADAFVRVEQDVRRRFGLSGDRSDGDGRFTLDGLAAGPRQIVALHEELGETRRRVEVAPGAPEIELRFVGGVRVTGQVVDAATGAGVVGASVELRLGRQAMPFGMGRGLRAVTGADGTFEIDHVPPGSYTPIADHEDFAVAQGQELEVGELGISDLLLEMGAGEAIAGRVVGLEFDDLASTTVIAMSPIGGFVQATLDYEGRFRFERLAAGDWNLQAMSSSGRQAVERVKIEPGAGTVEVELSFDGGLTVRGQVRRGGSPLPGIDLRVVNSEKFSFSEARTDADGRFELTGLQPGPHTVQLERPGGSHLLQEERVLETDDEWFFDLRSASVAGRVVDGDGQGVADATVSVRPASADATVLAHLARSQVATDSFGNFDLGDVAAGVYRVVASKAGYARTERPLEIADAPQRDLEVVLQRSAGLVVTPLRAGAGRPTALSFAVLGADGEAIETGTVQVDSDGRARFDSLPAGELPLLLAEPGGPSAEVQVRSPGDAGTVQLPAGGLLRVEMPELFAAGVRAEIEILRADGRPYRAVEDSTGWARWLRGSEYRRSLPAGSYTVEIDAGDEGSWQRPVAITPGGEATLRVP